MFARFNGRNERLDFDRSSAAGVHEVSYTRFSGVVIEAGQRLSGTMVFSIVYVKKHAGLSRSRSAILAWRGASTSSS